MQDESGSSDISPAARETLHAVCAAGLDSSTHAFRSEPLADADWTWLQDQVVAQRLAGLQIEAVRGGQFPVTAEQRAHASALARRVLTRSMTLEMALLHAQSLMDTQGIPTRVLKGSAVAVLDYPDPSLRPFVDVDLLVRGDDFDSAARSLPTLGYARRYPEPRPGFDRRFGKGASFLDPDGNAVDLHRTLVMGPFGLTVDLDALWERPTEFTVAGKRLLALSDEARLLHASYHAVLGDWPRRLLPYRDIAQMVLRRRFDEERLYRMSEHCGADALLALGITGAWELLSLPDEPGLVGWARRYSVSASEHRQISLYTTKRNSYAAKSFGALREIPRLRDKVAFTGAPPPARTRIRSRPPCLAMGPAPARADPDPR